MTFTIITTTLHKHLRWSLGKQVPFMCVDDLALKINILYISVRYSVHVFMSIMFS